MTSREIKDLNDEDKTLSLYNKMQENIILFSEKDLFDKIQQTKQKSKANKFFLIVTCVTDERFVSKIVKNPRIQF